jgi:hypothetical protein
MNDGQWIPHSHFNAHHSALIIHKRVMESHIFP